MFTTTGPGNHTGALISKLAACAVTALTIASFLAPLPASAAFGRRPPTTPGNFHVTGTTTGSVSLVWTASKAGSDPNFFYVMVRANDGFTLNVGTVTSYTWNIGLQGGETDSFYIYAIDLDRNKSANSPTVTVTLPTPPPPPPPAAPVLSLVNVTPTTITVSWPAPTGLNERNIAGYVLFVNGVAAGNDNLEYDAATEWTVISLTQGTPYTITVEAVGTGGDSPMSNPVTATTTTTTNTTPPTAPTGLTGASDGGGEAIVSWNPSTSPYEPQSQIEYRFYVDGMLESDADVVGETSNQYVFPNPPGSSGPEQIYVVAVDQYGNVSAPSNILTVEF